MPQVFLHCEHEVELPIVPVSGMRDNRLYAVDLPDGSFRFVITITRPDGAIAVGPLPADVSLDDDASATELPEIGRIEADEDDAIDNPTPFEVVKYIEQHHAAARIVIHLKAGGDDGGDEDEEGEREQELE